MTNPVFIYCLKDPKTGDVRYIGKTNNLKKRFSEHLRRSAREKNHLGNWLRSLKGEKPILAVLHGVAEHECWAEEERRYISCARAMGVDLVNATEGGEGTVGYRHTQEARAAMSAAHAGVPMSPEHCAALSAAHMGVPMPHNVRAAISAATTGITRGPYKKKVC